MPLPKHTPNAPQDGCCSHTPPETKPAPCCPDAKDQSPCCCQGSTPQEPEGCCQNQTQDNGCCQGSAQDNGCCQPQSSVKTGPCCQTPSPFLGVQGTRSWNIRYLLTISALAALWWLVYSQILGFSNWLVFKVLGFETTSHLAGSIEFFLYDTLKILLLLVALIYVISWARAALNVEKVRDYLAAKRRGVGYLFGATFGAVTPFCSCSSIPLFLGFTSAGIPIGISMSFLITSPLINEIAVVLLWGLLGWKFTVAYVVVGMLAGIIGGFFMDSLRAERWLQPFVREAAGRAPVVQTAEGQNIRLSIRQRHYFAYAETTTIFKRVWKWVIIGVGIGAALHGFVPENWFAEHFSAQQWWTVPAAVLVAVPLYSNVTGIIPIMESLLLKGLPLGTTLAFCMGSVVASIPEFMMLRQIMTWRLQAAFVAYLWVMLTLVGWLFNYIGPRIL